jgi:Phage stabilisation protein
MKTPILGSTYVARSVNAADSRMVNLFPEVVPEGGKEPAFLQRTPGIRKLSTVGSGPIRGVWAFSADDGVGFVVSGTELYKINNSYSAIKIGNVSGTGPVSMSDNGTQLFIACNGPSYIYNATTDTFGKITDPDFPGAVTVCYLDGYFVFNEPYSQKIWITALLDGTSINPLEFASAEGSPDNLLAVVSNFREVWAFGTNSIECWYDTGATDFPLQRIQGAFNELGLAAPYSVAKMDNGLFWLGRDRRGQGMVYRANGYTGQRISTHAVEWQIQQYSDISDAIAYTYQQDGHSFYVLIFPTANTTWVYDAATQAWHERAGWKNGEFTRHRSNCQMFFNNEVVVGDYENGNIYAFDLEDYSDNGDIQKWLRTWRALPTGQNNLHRTAQHSLQIDIESGVGLNAGPTGSPIQGQDPQVMLRWSDDGGHTWSNEHWSPIGKIGEYYRRVFFRRLGMTMKLRDRVYELSMTDPVKTAIMGAELLISPTNA